MNSSSKQNSTQAGSTGEEAQVATGYPLASSGLSSVVPKLYKNLTLTIADAMGDTSMSQQKLMVFLTVAESTLSKAPMGVLEIAKVCQVSDAAASRNIAELGRGLRVKGVLIPGAGLVEQQEDPLNYSRKLIYMTAKGYRLFESLAEKLVMFVQKGK